MLGIGCVRCRVKTGSPGFAAQSMSGLIAGRIAAPSQPPVARRGSLRILTAGDGDHRPSPRPVPVRWCQTSASSSAVNGRALVETVHKAPAFVTGAFLVPGKAPCLRAGEHRAAVHSGRRHDRPGQDLPDVPEHGEPAVVDRGDDRDQTAGTQLDADPFGGLGVDEDPASIRDPRSEIRDPRSGRGGGAGDPGS